MCTSHYRRPWLGHDARHQRAARGGHLLVGFQKVEKLLVETDRYADLRAAGTDVTVWAIGPQPADPRLAELDYREARRDTSRLDAQWFLVSERPEPLAFVSYELGDPASFGVGGAATPGKRFVRFVSDDPDVVALLVDALRPLGAPPAPRAARPPRTPPEPLPRPSNPPRPRS